MIIIKKIILFFSLLFLFNTLEVDSNNDKVLLYDKNNLHDEIHKSIYFNNMNSNDLEIILNNSNIRVLSYIIDNKKYYVRSIDELYDKYTNNKSLNEKLYYDKYGIIIDGINIVCETKELIKLEELSSIY